MSDAVQVVRNDAKSRYEVTVDGTVAGFTVFGPDAAGRVVFPHTEVDPAFAGRGLGTILIGSALADVAARGETIVPVCSFVVKYLESHEVPGLKVHWRGRNREREASTVAPPAERHPGDEGVGR